MLENSQSLQIFCDFHPQVTTEIFCVTFQPLCLSCEFLMMEKIRLVFICSVYHVGRCDDDDDGAYMSGNDG